MRSGYKKLGKYIQEVNNRNTDLKVDRLLGVSIQKILIPSIANTVGTDMSTYKIIKKDQFAYGPVTSRNGDKISVALLDEYNEAIVSQAYVVFEVIDQNELLPEYLMMWFRRPEFDRYARFKSHGSARETFDWQEMCEVGLPVPSIEKQREIVKEYNTIVNRIKLKEQFNQKLEETAQALYRHWFVDFEFPDENGEPYKSAGGKMVWNDELEKEIPEGWEACPLNETADVSAGGDKPTDVSENQTELYNIPIYANSTVDEGLYGFTIKPKVIKNSITVSARGAIIGYTVLRHTPFYPIVRLIVVTPHYENQVGYLFECIKNFRFNNEASAQGQLTVPDISSFNVLKPDSELMDLYQYYFKPLDDKIALSKKELKLLKTLQDLLLSKMTKVENEMVTV